MAVTDRMTGKNLVVRWIDTSGTVTLSGDQTVFSPSLEMGMVDLSAGADTVKVYQASLKDFTASFETFYTGTAGTAVQARMIEGNTGTLLWAPEGTAAGKMKWGIPAIVSKYDMSYPFDNGAKITVEFKSQGALAFDGRSAVWP